MHIVKLKVRAKVKHLNLKNKRINKKRKSKKNNNVNHRLSQKKINKEKSVTSITRKTNP